MQSHTMATRSKTQKQEQQTPSSSQAPSAQTTSSPVQSAPIGEFAKSTRLSRLDEKNTLIGLNNRLAAIIERNHQLELENSQLSFQVETAEETLKVTTKTINESIGKENTDLRRQLLECQNDKSKALLQGQEAKKQLVEANAKLQQNKSEIADLRKEANGFREEAAARKAELHQQKAENVQLTSKNKNLEADHKKLGDEIAKTRKQNEVLTLQNAELTNQLESKSLEIVSKIELHVQEVTALRSFNQKKIEEVGEKLSKDYEMNVQNVIKALRTECEKQLANNKSEQENLFKLKEIDLIKQKDSVTAALQAKTNDLQTLEKSLTTTKARVTILEKEKDFLTGQVKGLEDLMKAESEAALALTKNLEARIKTLQDEKTQLINDYQDLMEIKVALDNEIATYRQLLEGEEERLNSSMEARKISRKRQWNAK